MSEPALLGLGDSGEPLLLWRFARPLRAVASAPFGGGIGDRQWVMNVQVPSGYSRTDLEAHIGGLAHALGCEGAGVGFLTAASVDTWTSGADEEVVAYATVGLHHPTWAAAPELAREARRPGTVNVVAFVPTALADAALVNAVITTTEAKAQALLEHGVEGTGTASDALCVLAPTHGPTETFAGPRSRIGASLARAVHDAIAAGAAAWPTRAGPTG